MKQVPAVAFTGSKRAPARPPVSCATKRLILTCVLTLAAIQHCRAGDLPIRSLTPGAINADVTQENIETTVCARGWTKSIRPPAYYTNRLKKRQIREYGYPDHDPRNFEEDHLIPLNVGGNPTDPRNLWPEPRYSEWNADRKDQLEFAMYKAVCHHDVSLAEARRAFAENWIEAYQRYGDLIKRYSR